jgi:serpin B
MYFRASWRKPFLAEITRDESFRVGPVDRVTVPMMHEHSYAKDYDYFGDDTLQVLEVSCAGGQYALDVLLPRRWDGLPDLEASLRPQALESWIMGMKAPEEIDIALPKFLISSRVSLKEALAKLGVRLAFEEVADFSGVNGKSNDLFLADVIHAATIDLNEKGIEAAAALEYLVPDAFGDVPVSFHADHPFVFLVRDRRSGCILFLGRLVDPAQPTFGDRP